MWFNSMSHTTSINNKSRGKNTLHLFVSTFIGRSLERCYLLSYRGKISIDWPAQVNILLTPSCQRWYQMAKSNNNKLVPGAYYPGPRWGTFLNDPLTNPVRRLGLIIISKTLTWQAHKPTGHHAVLLLIRGSIVNRTKYC